MPKLIKPSNELEPLWVTADGKAVRLYHGHVIDVLRRLPAQSVHCCVTSPPYWGLRDYGTGTWVGGDEGCEHEGSRLDSRKEATKAIQGRDGNFARLLERAAGNNSVQGKSCLKCGARRIDQQLGSEPSPDCGTQGQAQCGRCFVCAMTAVFRQVRRVLRDDGTLWMNLGDSYTGGGSSWREPSEDCIALSTLTGGKDGTLRKVNRNGAPRCLPSGNLIGVPWRVALALQADGWILRQDIIWSKPSAMPECLDPETQVFIRVAGWVSRTTLNQLRRMNPLPEVLGPNGWVQVNNVWETEKSAMYLWAGKVEKFICSPDHRLPVSSDRRRKKVRLVEARKIRHEGYADYLLYSPIEKFLGDGSLQSWEGRCLSNWLGYVIGLYAAEGSYDGARGYRMKWTIHRDEEYIKNRFCEALKREGVDVKRFFDKNSKAQNLITVCDWLQRTIQTFVLGRDAKTKKLNIELLLNCPREFRQGLLDGYVDGDGSDRQGGGWITGSASRRLRDDVSTLASSLGVITSKGQGVNSGYARGDSRGIGKQFTSHMLWTPYISKRKAKSGTDGQFQVPPRSRKDLPGMRRMIDLEVEGGLFLIGDGLVVHNSVKNRCTKAHEYVFLLAKRQGYYYDAEAIKEPLKLDEDSYQKMLRAKSRSNHQKVGTRLDGGAGREVNGPNAYYEDNPDKLYVPSGANKRSVWTVVSQGYSGAHFATFPPKLIEPMILAGTSEKGCCAECGAPWARVVKLSGGSRADKENRSRRDRSLASNRNGIGGSLDGEPSDIETIGWNPGCDCGADTVPCTVLDPFVGSGTTAAVCVGLGRRAVGIDLSETYLRAHAIKRVVEAIRQTPFQGHLLPDKNRMTNDTGMKAKRIGLGGKG